MNTTVSYFPKKLRAVKYPLFPLLLLLPAWCVLEQSLLSIRVCTHPIPEQGGNQDQAATPPVKGTEGTFPLPDLPPGKPLRAGRTLYLFTGYLEHLINPNCTGEVHSTGYHDQPDSRQDLKCRLAPHSICQLILPHFSGQADSPRTILITNTALFQVLRDTVPQ